MLQKTFSVIGLGYGDEGKGTVVDYLASKYPNNSIVVRHSGGHQVGHTVKVNGIIHEFRNFGSGTFRGVPTYYDKACTVFPLGFHIEYDTLYKKCPDIIPIVYVHPLAPVTTLYDVACNRALNKMNNHGSVGMGFAATLKRHNFIPLHAFNLQHPTILKQKLVAVKTYYDKLSVGDTTGNDYFKKLYNEELQLLAKEGFTLENYIKSCSFFSNIVELKNIFEDTDFYNSIEYIIHEGNQGILLDKEHGFYPHVTYGKTTNATCGAVNEAYYVTRCYATKHGAGTLHNEGKLPIPLVNNQDEQNHLNPWQGEFRTGMLDFDYLKYAIEADQLDIVNNNSLIDHDKKYLVITCMDQIENPLIMVAGEELPLDTALFYGLVDGVLTNNSPDSATMGMQDIFIYDNN